MGLFRNATTSRASCEVEAGRTEARKLCRTALHEVCQCQSLDTARDGSKLVVMCQFGTVAGGFRIGIEFVFEGDGPTRIAISAPAPYPGTFSGKGKQIRDQAVAGLAAWLSEHGTTG
jgi:hypothetical protein